MHAGTSYDTGAPTIELRIYRNGELLVRELCETEEDAGAIVEQWSGVENVYVLLDDLSAHHAPGDILAPDELMASEDDGHPIASATLPGRGTE